MKQKGNFVKCSYCDEYEEGTFYGPIMCGYCVQKLLGYEVVVKKNSKPPHMCHSKALRAVLRGERGKGKGVGRGSTKTIHKCPDSTNVQRVARLYDAGNAPIKGVVPRLYGDRVGSGITKCPFCGTIHWIESGECPKCGK